jgi:hypothetical protein
MDNELMDPGALDLAVDMSGGVTRELVRIVRGAARRAMVTSANSIQPEHVEQAVDKLRDEYNNTLTREELIGILRQVNKTQELRSNDEKPMLDLLHNLMILKYPNGPGWYGVNPGVNPIVRKLIGV